jgi:hypothetical protein
VDLHKVPFAGRAPDLASPLYERLLDVALRRAQCTCVRLYVCVRAGPGGGGGGGGRGRLIDSIDSLPRLPALS